MIGQEKVRKGVEKLLGVKIGDWVYYNDFEEIREEGVDTYRHLGVRRVKVLYIFVRLWDDGSTEIVFSVKPRGTADMEDWCRNVYLSRKEAMDALKKGVLK